MEHSLNVNDTICAISTPPGSGGIAVVRISGPDARTISDKLWRGVPLSGVKSHTVHLGKLVDTQGETIDEAVSVVYQAPRSYTGEDVVELSVHGSTYIQATLMHNLCEVGCRVAAPGEFTRRAFENGKMDLPRAEAVADIISATSAAAHRLAVTQLNGHFSSKINELHDNLLNLASLLELELDFSEEDVTFADRVRLRDIASHTRDTINSLVRSFSTGDALRRGIPVAIIGQPNAGKSSLLNALLDSDRAIVSDIPGTTRDTIEDTIDIDGLTFRFTDTAGLRDTSDTIENIGIERALQKAANARIVIWLLPADGDSEADKAIYDQLKTTLAPYSTLLICISKNDLYKEEIAARTQLAKSQLLPISIHDVDSIDRLRQQLVSIVRADMPDDESLIVTNARHHQALSQAATALTRLIDGLDAQIYTDLIAQELREALHNLSSITGTITTDTILQSIFSHFCIGK